jgi:hypothetical protein
LQYAEVSNLGVTGLCGASAGIISAVYLAAFFGTLSLH